MKYCIGEEMKNLKKKMASVVVKIAEASVKNDINSTGSSWMYQPKIPKSAFDLKKNIK